MRDKSVDKAMEIKFGKPDYSKSFVKDNMVWTPLGDKVKLWRVDPVKREVINNG